MIVQQSPIGSTLKLSHLKNYGVILSNQLISPTCFNVLGVQEVLLLRIWRKRIASEPRDYEPDLELLECIIPYPRALHVF